MKKIVFFVYFGFSCLLIKGQNADSLNIKYEIIEGKNQTWGYDIYINNKLKIHQTTIPCIKGVNGFKTKNSAGKTAKLVIQKMKAGLMPPTITIEELKNIKAI